MRGSHHIPHLAESVNLPDDMAEVHLLREDRVGAGVDVASGGHLEAVHLAVLPTTLSADTHKVSYGKHCLDRYLWNYSIKYCVSVCPWTFFIHLVDFLQ